MDKLTISGANFSCNIGVTEKERSQKQEIIVDTDLFLDIKQASSTDDIHDAVNYSDVYDLLKEIVAKNQFMLIEAMAENIASAILENFPVEKVNVKIKKPGALSDKGVKYVSIKITRSKNG